ncbi:MAG TPA: hypothetical protein VH061_04330 [Solirubrobacteraceae bacterium]|jgi:hypothetical protein|nr:hypothetical protein [Solirubrobacteraceae bacterium]
MKADSASHEPLGSEQPEQSKMMPTNAIRRCAQPVLIALACAAGLVGYAVVPAAAFAESKWEAQSVPSTSELTELEAVSCISTSECFATGRASTALTAERWSGGKWTQQTVSSAGRAEDVSCVSATFCLVPSGGANFVHWNGTAWSEKGYNAAEIPVGAKEFQLKRVSCVSATFCMAVGGYKNASGHERTIAEKWSGASWSIVATPSEEGEKALNYLLDVVCTSTTSCTAVGSEGSKPVALRWNGTEWTVLSAPATTLGRISCSGPSACIGLGSVGYQTTEAWDGTKWTSTPVTQPEGSVQTTIHGISCVSASSCEVVGEYSPGIINADVTLAEHWNGATWVVQSTPNPFGEGMSQLTSVSCVPGTSVCEAVGYKREHVGAAKTFALRYE